LNNLIKSAPKYDAMLPGVAVSQAVRQQVEQVASEHGVSLGAIIRTSVEFFLLENAKLTINDDSQRVDDEKDIKQ
jgi:hypothetical protein